MFPLYGDSSCGSLGFGSGGVSLDLQFYTLLSCFPFCALLTMVMRDATFILCLRIYRMLCLLRAVVTDALDLVGDDLFVILVCFQCGLNFSIATFLYMSAFYSCFVFIRGTRTLCL